MTNKIDTRTEALCVNEIDRTWKIVARNKSGLWYYCGDLNHVSVYKLAHLTNSAARISLVTGRDELSDVICLYARICPGDGRAAT